jgi:hypothetical protein
MAAVVNRARRFAIPYIFGKQRALAHDTQHPRAATTGKPYITQLRQLTSNLSPLAALDERGKQRLTAWRLRSACAVFAGHCRL